MTVKELRALKRADLIEILYYLSKENDELRAENEKLNSRLDALIFAAAERSAVPVPPSASDESTGQLEPAEQESDNHDE